MWAHDMHESKNPRMGARNFAGVARYRRLRRAAVLRTMGRGGCARGAGAGAGAGRIVRALRREAREFWEFEGLTWAVVWGIFALALWGLVQLAEAVR